MLCRVWQISGRTSEHKQDTRRILATIVPDQVDLKPQELLQAESCRSRFIGGCEPHKYFIAVLGSIRFGSPSS